MRKTITASLLILTLGFNCVAHAEGEPPTLKDEGWGFSFTHDGLEDDPEGEPWYDVAALVADTSAESMKGCTLAIRHIKSRFSAEDYLSDACKSYRQYMGYKGETKEVQLGGVPGFKVSLTNEKTTRGPMLFACTKADAGQAFWFFKLDCRKSGFEDFPLGETAVDSFKLHKAGEAPSPKADLHHSARLSFSIETAGFKGKVKQPDTGFLATKFLFNSQREKDGYIQIHFRKKTGDLKAETRESIDRKYGYELCESKDLELFGREAARILVKAKSFDHWFEETLILDGDMVWSVICSFNTEGAKGKESPLVKAAASFKLLKEKAK